MALPLIAIAIAIVLVLVVGGALAYWNTITEFMLSTLLPWFDAEMPEVAALAREVFCAIDRLAVPLIQTIRRKWQQLKHWLLKQLVEVERNAEGVWVLRVTTFLRKQLEPGAPVVKVVREEVITDFTQLPDEVREMLFRRGAASTDVNAKIDETLARLEREAQA